MTPVTVPTTSTRPRWLAESGACRLATAIRHRLGALWTVRAPHNGAYLITDHADRHRIEVLMSRAVVVKSRDQHGRFDGGIWIDTDIATPGLVNAIVNATNTAKGWN